MRPCGHTGIGVLGCRLCELANERSTRGNKYRELWGEATPTVPGKEPNPQPPAPAMQVQGGPGTELKQLLSEVGVHQGNCACASRQKDMDTWGVEGCRARREEIVEWLRQEERRASWKTRLLAAFKGAAFVGKWLNPLDPLGSLVDEAIRRAADKVGGQMEPLRWACGVTTAVVPAADEKTHRDSVRVALTRRATLLPRTLRSLRDGGFPEPRLFVDGDGDAGSWEREFGLPVTCRQPLLRTAGNWVLALWELWIRHPRADRYAVFQDDLLCVGNLRQYLDRCVFPPQGYLNLFTFPTNAQIVEHVGNRPRVGWFEARHMPTGGNTQAQVYHGKAQQYGKGAVGLVFDRDGVEALLSSPRLIRRFLDEDAGWKKIDGAIVESLNQANWWEWCHYPSLLWHTGTYENGGSATGNNPQAQADSFPGEAFDALRFLDDPAHSAERGFGERAYAGYPAEERERRIADWRKELAAVRNALAEDERRLASEPVDKQRRRLTRAIERYREELRKLERNDPPYVVS